MVAVQREPKGREWAQNGHHDDWRDGAEALIPAVRRQAGGEPEGDLPAQSLDLSVVIPLLNERDSLEALHAKLDAVLSQLGLTSEIIFVDDGSTDGSTEVLRALCARDPRVQVIRLRRNFGQTAAFCAGFDNARGAVIVTMDADLQNDPADIPKLLERIDAGYDVASGWRIYRKDPLVTRRIPSTVANSLISVLTGVRLHDYGCSLKAYRREVLESVKLYGEMHRFIPAIVSWGGISIAEVPVNHFPRQFGRSKYGLTRVLKVLLDLMTVKFLLHYAARPMRLFGLFGMLGLLSGLLLGSYLTALKVLYDEPIGDRPLLMLTVLLVVVGVQFLVLGLLGELLMRTYYETQGKRTYLVRERMGGDVPATGVPRREVIG